MEESVWNAIRSLQMENDKLNKQIKELREENKRLKNSCNAHKETETQQEQP